MSKPANRAATYEDLFDIPDNVVGEILGGELVTHPRPGPKHAHASSMVGAALINKFKSRNTGDGSDGWWILDEPECHLGAEVVVGDIAGWRKSSMPELPETAWFSIRPDWVCEVVSPSTAKFDRGIKREIYAQEEVGFYWIVDPIAKTVEVLVLKNGAWVVTDVVADDQVVKLEPFEVMPFDLSELWA